MATLMGGLAVIFGAFAAHMLKTMLSPETFSAFQTGVSYQFYHAFALLGVGILYRRYNNKWINMSGMFFVTGTILFSGSLYLMAALELLKKGSLGPMGLITPVGGVLLILGWACFFIGIPAQRTPTEKSGSEG